MSLLRILMDRGGMPSMNEAQRIQAGGDMPPMRGFTPWPTSSGFEDQQKLMLQELLRAMEMRQHSPEQNLKRLLPLLKAR